MPADTQYLPLRAFVCRYGVIRVMHDTIGARYYLAGFDVQGSYAIDPAAFMERREIVALADDPGEPAARSPITERQ